MRLAGGSMALVRALARRLPEDRLVLNAPVSAITRDGDGLRLTLPDAEVSADHVIATIPPRVLHDTVTFSPALPGETRKLWQDTPTWMAPQAKFFALYEEPFWREAGLSGTAQSMVGPMPEIHDACSAGGQAALFGFLGVGASDRATLGQEALTCACIEQLTRLFGSQAAHPTATLFKDWAADPLTAAPLDITASGHPEPVASWVHGDWTTRLTLAGSDAAPREPGYLAGAVSASVSAVESMLRNIE